MIFIKYQVLLNNVSITSDDVVFKRGILEETVFVNFGDVGSTKVCELNDSPTKFCKLPIFNKSLLVDPHARFTLARYPNGNIEAYTGQEDNNWIPYSITINENKSKIGNNWWIPDPFPIPKQMFKNLSCNINQFFMQK